MPSRRTFLAQSSILGAGILSGTELFSAAPAAKLPFSLSLKAGNIGVSLPLPELLEAAARHGFESVSVDADSLLALSEKEQKKLRKQLDKRNLTWGAANLPMDFRKDEATYQQGLAELPAKAAILQSFGVTRMGTWIMPTHPSLSYLPNFLQHSQRLREIARILGEYEIRFGLEYVAPKTLMSRSRYPFLRTMGECRELIAAIDRPNVGLVLDAFHWYCAEDSVEEILALKNSDIVAVDLNDATVGRSRDEQIDGQRQLPLASGLIDLKPFMAALVKVGYDGPCRAEPFNQPLRDMAPEAALAATAKAMKAAFSLVK